MARSPLALVVVVLVGVLSAGAYWQFVHVPQQQQKQAAGPSGGRGGPGGPVAVEAQVVEVGPAETTVSAVGTLLSNEAVTIRPEVAGRITTINFVEGGKVTKDQVLIELDSSTERANLSEVQARLELARTNLERARELRRSNVGTQRSLDEAEAGFRIAEAAVEVSQAQLAKRMIKAPFPARVGLRHVSIGEFVTSGTAIVGLEQIDPLKVDFRIPELFLTALKIGQRIDVTLDAFPNEHFVGAVRAVDPLVDERGRSIIVRAQLDNAEERLRPGLFARVQLTLAERPDALWVAEETLVPQGNKQFVYKVVAQDEGKPKIVKLTEVKLGKRRQGEVEIVAGLARNDVVVTAGLLKIRDGAAVNPTLVRPNAVPAGDNAPVTSAPNPPAGAAAPATVGSPPPVTPASTARQS